MKNKITVMKKYFTFLLFVIAIQGFSQTYPITSINISLPANPDANTANWGSGTSLFVVTASSKPVNGRVDGFVVESKILITIKKGGTRACGAYTENTAPASNFNTLTKVWSGISAVALLGQECTLAPGDYEISVQFFGHGAAGLTPLSEEKTKTFSIRVVEQQVFQAPEPIAPADGTLFSETELQKPILFRWIPIIPKPQDPVTYRLRVWQLMQGQTGTQVMKVNQPIITKYVDNITQAVIANLISDPCKPPYLCDFVWNVQALNREGKPVGENSGTSKAFQFSANSCDVKLVLKLTSVECLSSINGNNNYKICLSATYTSPDFNLTYTTAATSGFKAYPFASSTSYTVANIAPALQVQNSGTGSTVDYCLNVSVPIGQTSIKIGLQGDDNDSGPMTCQPDAELNIRLPECYPSCDCGEWSNSVVEIQAKDATTSRLKCSGNASLSIGIYQFHFPDFACNPKDSSCQVSYEWSVQGIASGNGTGQIFRFNFSQTGIYTVNITPLCGGKRCTPCKIVIKVEDIQSPPDVPKSLPDHKCENYSFELRKIYSGDSIAYEGSITNKYSESELKNKPQNFRINIRNNSVIGIDSRAPKDWTRTPSKFPPPISQIKWNHNSGDIPQGETKLGTLYFAVPTSNPYYVVYDWLNKEGEILCKDSIALIDTRFYYNLDKEPSYTFNEISNSILRVQFSNPYASVENIQLTVYDVEEKKIKRKSKDVIKLHSVTGLNRISIDIKDYNLEPGRLYLLTISDFHNTFNFNFKVTNDREK
jgi:hypothetical protein